VVFPLQLFPNREIRGIKTFLSNKSVILQLFLKFQNSSGSFDLKKSSAFNQKQERSKHISFKNERFSS